jgi:hypothetical protein
VSRIRAAAPPAGVETRELGGAIAATVRDHDDLEQVARIFLRERFSMRAEMFASSLRAAMTMLTGIWR